MTKEQPDIDIQFYQLVITFQAQAWQSMGKVASPFSGKIERSLEQAKFSIDMLEMFKRKTEGNTSEDESRLLEQALYELRLNYVEEAKKGETQESEASAEKSEPDPDDSKPDTDSDKTTE